MGKTKAIARGEKVAKLAKESKKPTVKEGRVTKPTQTPRAKSKEIAKSAASNHAVRELSKKAKKAPTPEPESDSTDSDSRSQVSSESDSDSSASSSEDEEVATKVSIRTNGVAKPSAIAESGDSSDASSGSSNDSSEDENSESEAAAPKIHGVKPKLNGAAELAVGPRTDSDSDSSSEEGNSSEESDSSEDEDEKSAVDTKINGFTKAEAVKNVEASSDSVSESGSDSNSSNDSSDSDGSSASESENEEVLTKKRKAEHESAPTVKKTKTNDESEDGVKNLFVGNLSWNVDEEWLARDFEKFGEIVGCRIVTDKESGRSRGFGYVEFSTSAAAKSAQAAMHQFSLDGRALNVDFSTPRQKGGEKTGDRAKRFGDALGTPSNTLFVGNIAFDATNDMISDAFGEYGTLTRVSLPTDRETGAPKGFGYVDFTSMDDAKAALEALNGAEIAGRPIRLDYAAPRDGNSGPPQRGGFGNRGRGGDRGRGGRGGGFGGRGGGRGGARGGKGNSTNRGGFGDFKGSKMTF